MHALQIDLEVSIVVEMGRAMALSIKDPRADELACEVARLAVESLTEAVASALEERLERLRCQRPGRRRLAGRTRRDRPALRGAPGARPADAGRDHRLL